MYDFLDKLLNLSELLFLSTFDQNNNTCQKDLLEDINETIPVKSVTLCSYYSRCPTDVALQSPSPTLHISNKEVIWHELTFDMIEYHSFHSLKKKT